MRLSSIPTSVGHQNPLAAAAIKEFGTPEYVAYELLSGFGMTDANDKVGQKLVAGIKSGKTLASLLSSYDADMIPIFKAKWRLRVVDLKFADFSERTKSMILAREWGRKNPYGIKNDEARKQTQASRFRPGLNEPIVMIKRQDGYELLEGWHRTFAAFEKTKNPETDSVRIRAWVGV